MRQAFRSTIRVEPEVKYIYIMDQKKAPRAAVEVVKSAIERELREREGGDRKLESPDDRHLVVACS